MTNGGKSAVVTIYVKSPFLDGHISVFQFVNVTISYFVENPYLDTIPNLEVSVYVVGYKSVGMFGCFYVQV